MVILTRMKKLLAIFYSLLAVGTFSQEYESYQVRPDILQLTPQRHNLGRQWENFKRGGIEMVAMVLEMYPDYEIYFLARDAEIFYDQARIVLRDDLLELERIHLLNISRRNVRAEGVEHYLAQEGLSETSLKEGKKVLFVDTGFHATIPDIIKSYFNPRYSAQIRTHLFVSSNPEHPSSRSSLSWIYQRAAQVHLGSLSSDISLYEGMGHYTDRADHFEQRDGQWHAMGPIRSSREVESRNRKEVVEYMEDLLHFNQTGEGRELYRQRSQIWNELYELGQHRSKAELIVRLQSLLSDGNSHGEAIVRDFIEAIQCNDIIVEEKRPRLQDLGLREVIYSITDERLLIEEFPKWKEVFKNPEAEINELLAKQDVVTLSELINEVENKRFYRVFFRQIGSRNDKINRDFIMVVIRREEEIELQRLAQWAFLERGAEMKDLIAKTIAAARKIQDGLTLINLAKYVFPKYGAEMKDLIAKTIAAAREIQDREILHNLFRYVFSKYGAEMKDLIVEAIAAAQEFPGGRWWPIRYVFRWHGAEMKDLIAERIVAARRIRDGSTLQEFVRWVFPR